MNSLEIEQSSITHPGHLSEEELTLLQPPDMPPIKLRLGKTDLTRRDAGSIWIIVQWVAGVAAAGGVGAFGKDIYEWVKLEAKG